MHGHACTRNRGEESCSRADGSASHHRWSVHNCQTRGGAASGHPNPDPADMPTSSWSALTSHPQVLAACGNGQSPHNPNQIVSLWSYCQLWQGPCLASNAHRTSQAQESPTRWHLVCEVVHPQRRPITCHPIQRHVCLKGSSNACRRHLQGLLRHGRCRRFPEREPFLRLLQQQMPVFARSEPRTWLHDAPVPAVLLRHHHQASGHKSGLPV
mmetsp:Transcript_75855/g.149993  ORF Transcript_75855/g.149993 Transcript_75855/m.149993 type:complete len:212 (+) Transcript_75855:777-1412(+)